MKAISIKQPWAWAIANGHKTIETRTWPTKYRGEILIVASKAPDRIVMQRFKDIFGDEILSQMEYGKAIATAKIVGCKLMTKADEKGAMCDIYDRAWSWRLENVQKIDTFDVKGRLGIYEVEIPK